MNPPMPTTGGSYLRDKDGSLIRQPEPEAVQDAAPATIAQITVDEPVTVAVTLLPADPLTPRKGGK